MGAYLAYKALTDLEFAYLSGAVLIAAALLLLVSLLIGTVYDLFQKFRGAKDGEDQREGPRNPS